MGDQVVEVEQVEGSGWALGELEAVHDVDRWVWAELVDELEDVAGERWKIDRGSDALFVWVEWLHGWRLLGLHRTGRWAACKRGRALGCFGRAVKVWRGKGLDRAASPSTGRFGRDGPYAWLS